MTLLLLAFLLLGAALYTVGGWEPVIVTALFLFGLELYLDLRRYRHG